MRRGNRMRIHYIFPHPDDECFGPALAIARQKRTGREVHLSTLTRGGATKQRHRLGLSVEQMGAVRERELRAAGAVLGLTSQAVLDLPDGGLAEMDPREIESVVEAEIRRVRPEVIVTYAVHGISGFRDHLVIHAVVKRLFCELREQSPDAPRRLAMFTLAPSAMPDGIFNLATSPEGRIGAALGAAAEDIECAHRALACYETYATIIADADPLKRVGETVYFELFGESPSPPLGDLDEGL
jgi:N-acetylglucosamine malate deacetylase 2